jgi:hypothetical protein
MNFVKETQQNKTISEKLRKSFLGKLSIVLISFLIFSCSNDCSFEKKRFINNLDLINQLKDSIINIKTDNLELNVDYIEDMINKNDVIILNSLSINKIQKIGNSVVFSFKKRYEKNWFDKKFDDKIKFCEVHLIFSKNVEIMNRIINYEQFSECRIQKEIINNEWTYLFQIKSCD